MLPFGIPMIAPLDSLRLVILPRSIGDIEPGLAEPNMKENRMDISAGSIVLDQLPNAGVL